jgi:glycosyltransferase involved in cell wall biosynthesis
MKIMHVTKKYPPALGGDAVVVKNLQEQQQAAGHDVVIVTSRCPGIKNDANIYKVGLTDTPQNLDAITIKRLVSLVILAVQMFFIIRKERPALIHTHSIDMAFFVSFAARLFKVPLVHTFHIVTFYDTAQSPLRRKTELWLAKKAGLRAVTAPNNYDVNQLRRGGLSQAALLPNGVDMTFWQAAPSRPKNHTFTFVAVGRLEEQKGYDALITAVAILSKQTARPFKVIIIGEGSLQAHLQQRINNEGLGHIIHLAGSKTPREVHQQFTHADAAICTSLYETTPLTLLEAWATHLPVVTTPVGIIRDATTDFNAAFITHAKVATLAETMQSCITNETKRLDVAKNGYAEATKYTWPAITKTADAIYRSVL